MTDQFKQIETIVKAKIDGVDALLVIGDFNRELMNPRLLPWREEHVSWLQKVVTVPSCTLRPSINPIDFVLVATIRDGLKLEPISVDMSDVVHLVPRRISDHCPMAFQLSN
ncbi:MULTISPECIES: hypothetical protein [unclassified Mesorhizobium]|uniref:hypothetical protein n=1 Tax=unclassified Mesorhizobium TaxID=325217 RepID=UPI0012EC7AFF|nr:hypothetical protein [Mesorhizobium sp. LSJC268A00]